MSYNNKVYVYRNTRAGNYSIRVRGVVNCHADWVRIDGSYRDVPLGFQVSLKGRERVLRTKQKNVHAYVWGYDVSANSMVIQDDFYQFRCFMEEIIYKPYEEEYFYQVSNKRKVISADIVYLTPKGVFAENLVYG